MVVFRVEASVYVVAMLVEGASQVFEGVAGFESVMVLKSMVEF